ncbi:hypothetical protein CO154_01865 [Candidatus Pacearchaeota archaeon CG_4_9_14_3_um_filter_31_7]|nr:MAG: hypothetical protein AUJ10_00820 [Candidatus Pacearchaeota archaeon CG1_02_31_27]PIN92357.1 MAG: hypothetical protein COU55_00930 [Candidatus Pacearchaeota archaeon CG10_big_fil_rev_8_21_14_0_10_31_59]PIZ80659.1 MAG: hypothetical protein COX99_01960 [Candidatus Pacearchaeota archaeon CG_4_10_14_0_2_um_filter_31_10]PJA70636.1 MAG: hypothetical protein CO154_01865 [Candidatus Pacearchaeota archaeon CG_4_9_14_3_um_filter_31_7]
MKNKTANIALLVVFIAVAIAWLIFALRYFLRNDLVGGILGLTSVILSLILISRQILLLKRK